MKFFACLLGMAAFSTTVIHANCGLDFCPRLAPGETPTNHSASLHIKNAAFNLDSGSGYYEELLPRYEYTGIRSWVFGGSLPVMALTVHSKTPPRDSKTTYGISNPLLYTSWYTRLNVATLLYLGMQLELPLGNFESGMASDHFMLVPYAMVEKSMGFGYGLGSLGYCQAFSTGSGEHPVYVSPHEDREILYRVGAGLQQLEGTLKQRIYLDGRYAVVHDLEGQGRSHVSGGMALDYTVGNHLILSPSVDLPFTSPRRFDWNAGVEVKALF